MNNKDWPIDGKKRRVKISNDTEYLVSIFPSQSERLAYCLQFVIDFNGDKKAVNIGISDHLITIWKLNNVMKEETLINIALQKIRNWLATGETIENGKEFIFTSDNSPNTVEQAQKMLDEEFEKIMEDKNRV
jgi:hypothetical protein